MKPPPARRSRVPGAGRLLHGQGEAVFRALPDRVLANLRSPASENALAWNLLYPLAQPTLSLAELLSVRPLWGTQWEVEEDELRPYFWGYGMEGKRLEGLDEALLALDGRPNATEVDLFLLGRSNLILAELKNRAHLGRCSRYEAERCPEIHAGADAGEEGCRYWEQGASSFSLHLDFGAKPAPGDPSPPCNRHYQLGRTLLLGRILAAQRGARLHFWLVTPRRRWGAHRRAWMDFTERVRDDALWRRCRVLAWEDLQALASKA